MEPFGGDAGIVTKLCPTLLTPRAVARQAPQSMGFSRQENLSVLPFPSPVEPFVPLQRRVLPPASVS